MKVKETIRTTRYDDNGRPVVTERTVYYDQDMDRNYDYATEYAMGSAHRVHRSSLERVFEAYRDYCNTFNWD